MKNKKNIAFLLLLFSVTLIFSCKLDEGKERTQETEYEELNEYLSGLIEDNIDVDTTDLGVFYIEKETGTGLYPQQGDTLSILYFGYHLNGTIFDASYVYFIDSIYQFVFMETPMIEGLIDGLKLMNEGSMYEFIIPSRLAYGAEGSIYIGPYRSLIFVVEMRAIKPKNEEQG